MKYFPLLVIVAAFICFGLAIALVAGDHSAEELQRFEERIELAREVCEKHGAYGFDVQMFRGDFVCNFTTFPQR